MHMTSDELLNLRLYNQLLSTHEKKAPHEIVSWMGAMQSQALELAKWAIGSRLQESRATDITEALNRGEVIRTHILLNGKIIGSWKKSMKKNVPQISLTFFEKMPKKSVALFQSAVERLEKFYAQV